MTDSKEFGLVSQIVIPAQIRHRQATTEVKKQEMLYWQGFH